MRSRFLFLSPALAAVSATLAMPRRGSATGTHRLSDLLVVTNQTVQQFGLAAVQDTLNAELAAHNRVLRENMGAFVTPTTEREEAEGGATTDGEMEEVDPDFGRARTQMQQPAGKVAYPLRNFQFAVGWTAEFLETATPADIATSTINAETAHVRALQRAMREALHRPTNYDFEDFLTDRATINVKALYNGDGTVPPIGRNLEVFDNTHNHYTAITTDITAAAMNALILNVAEHGPSASVQVWIALAQEASVRALPGFAPYQDVRVRVGTDQTIGVSPLDPLNFANRAIGVYGGAEIWVKPICIPNYLIALNTGAAAKPLRMREPREEARRGLRTLAEIATFPLQARYMGARFGFGVYNRGAAAVLQINAADTNYDTPAGL